MSNNVILIGFIVAGLALLFAIGAVIRERMLARRAVAPRRRRRRRGNTWGQRLSRAAAAVAGFATNLWRRIFPAPVAPAAGNTRRRQSLLFQFFGIVDDARRVIKYSLLLGFREFLVFTAVMALIAYIAGPLSSMMLIVGVLWTLMVASLVYRTGGILMDAALLVAILKVPTEAGAAMRKVLLWVLASRVFVIVYFFFVPSFGALTLILLCLVLAAFAFARLKHPAMAAIMSLLAFGTLVFIYGRALYNYEGHNLTVATVKGWIFRQHVSPELMLVAKRDVHMKDKTGKVIVILPAGTQVSCARDADADTRDVHPKACSKLKNHIMKAPVYLPIDPRNPDLGFQEKYVWVAADLFRTARGNKLELYQYTMEATTTRTAQQPPRVSNASFQPSPPAPQPAAEVEKALYDPNDRFVSNFPPQTHRLENIDIPVQFGGTCAPVEGVAPDAEVEVHLTGIVITMDGSLGPGDAKKFISSKPNPRDYAFPEKGMLSSGVVIATNLNFTDRIQIGSSGHRIKMKEGMLCFAINIPYEAQRYTQGHYQAQVYRVYDRPADVTP